MTISSDVEKFLAAGKRHQQKRGRRRRKLDEFMARMRKIFGEHLPYFIPSTVDSQKRTRKPKLKWKHEHTDRSTMESEEWERCMQDALTEEKEDGCIQVKLGEQSFNLCVADADADEVVEPFLEANPILRTTLQTRGSKGRHFWFRIEGDYPRHKKRIIWNGHVIEFLTEDCLCTIEGTHYITGEKYEMPYPAPPVTIKIEDLKPPEGGEWEAKTSSNGAGTKHTRSHTHGTASKHGGIDWKAYDAAIDSGGELIEILVTEYFDATEVDGIWRCGDITGRPPSNRGSFVIEPNGRCTEWDDESHPTLMDAICSEERDEKNTYDDIFTFLAAQGDEYNFFMPPDPEDLPQVLLPYLGRNESAFARDVAENLPENALFKKDGSVVELESDDTLGTDDNVAIAPFGLTTSKFSVMKALRLATWVEQYMETGVEVEVEKDVREFRAKTMTDLMARRMLVGESFSKRINRINRILDVAIPIRTIQGDIIYPQVGYNKSLQLYCDSRSPTVKKLEHQRALDIILKDVYGEFCFKDEQSKTHAIARLITPYVRGIMGFHVRMPLWWFDGNRPGTGKDYCNGVTQLVYQGRAFEDAPVGESSEETRKRITAALVAGRRMMYFANCQFHLSDPTLLTAITDSVFRTRMLGATDAESDLEIINEIEFALSARMTLKWR
jgi:hypothetical protein